VSCTETTEEGRNKKSPPIGAKGYLPVKFSLAGYDYSKENTRNFSDWGTQPENMVKNVRLVFYGTESDDVVRQVIDLDASNIISNMDVGYFFGNDVYDYRPTEFSFISRPLELTVSEYDILAIYNPTRAIINMTAEGQPRSALENVYLEIGGAVTNAPELTGMNANRFVMTNVKGLYRVTPDDFFVTSPIINDEVVKELPSIFVERAVAKIALTFGGFDPTLKTTETRANNYSIIPLGWNVDIVNKKSYLMRKMTFKAGGEMESPNIDIEEFYDWGRFVEEYGNLYGIDPNFDKSLSEAYGGSEADRRSNFNYCTKNDLTKAISNMSGPRGEHEWVYIPENTMEADGQYQDVTTRIILKARFSYEPFIKYNGIIVMDPIRINLMISECYGKNDQEMQELIDNGEIPEKFKHFNQVANFLIDEKNHNPNEDLYQQYPYETTSLRYITPECNFLLYGGGITYYSIPIRHFSDAQAPHPMEYGRYGVLRNNMYMVYVQAVYGPGDIELPAPNSTPNDTDTELDYEIYVFGWNEEIDLEYIFGD